LVGLGKLSFNSERHWLARKDLFRELADIAYLPPRTKYKLEGIESFEVAIGGAPAEGKLPARIIRREQIPTAVRGGANAKRGVSTLADSDELTERLVVYEIHTPSTNRSKGRKSAYSSILYDIYCMMLSLCTWLRGKSESVNNL
jgi:5-deoxy-glucuronate isomerase